MAELYLEPSEAGLRTRSIHWVIYICRYSSTRETPVRVKNVCFEQPTEVRMLERSSILAIVVTFHPDSSFPERFKRLAGQVDAVLIVDNNSDASAVLMLRETASRLDMGLLL